MVPGRHRNWAFLAIGLAAILADTAGSPGGERGAPHRERRDRIPRQTPASATPEHSSLAPHFPSRSPPRALRPEGGLAQCACAACAWGRTIGHAGGPRGHAHGAGGWQEQGRRTDHVEVVGRAHEEDEGQRVRERSTSSASASGSLSAHASPASHLAFKRGTAPVSALRQTPSIGGT